MTIFCDRGDTADSLLRRDADGNILILFYCGKRLCSLERGADDGMGLILVIIKF